MALFKNLGMIFLCKYSICLGLSTKNILYLKERLLSEYSFDEVHISDYCRQCEAAQVIELISYTEEVVDTCVIPCAQVERFWC